MIDKRSDLAEPSAGDELICADAGRQSPRARLEHLRGALAHIEAACGQPPIGAGAVQFRLGDNMPDLTLRRAALHEVTASEAGDGAAALAFTLALAIRSSLAEQASTQPSRPATPHGHILMVLEGMSGQECGMPYGHGLAGFGLDPARILLLCTRRPVEALWAIEEGLRCGALAAVIGIFAKLPRAYDLTASRRLVLAARGSGLPALLAIIGEGGSAPRIASAAETRWQIAARPSAMGMAGEPTTPAFTANLLRLRVGDPATFEMDWNHDTRSFSTIPSCAPLSRPLAAAPADRPDQTARAG